MGVFVITGASSGIGKAAKEILEEKGHEVFNIDYKGGDVTANLALPEERQKAIDAVIEKYPDGIDGLLCNAGVGPVVPADQMWAINFFAPITIAKGLRSSLAKKNGACVVTLSNTISNDMIVREDWVEMMVNTMDEERVLEYARTIPPKMAPLCYSSGKNALARWIRRTAGSWGVGQVRINGIAPGNTNTPMTAGMTDEQWEAALLIPIPTRYGQKTFLDAEEIANVMVFLVLPESKGMDGSIVFVDGGIDALLRSERF
ncbi:MAG: SDR family oxidoreductase [Tissierellia bacterium]|nr:SDR family oxidoreductase [Tissierellia bacterium]